MLSFIARVQMIACTAILISLASTESLSTSSSAEQVHSYTKHGLEETQTRVTSASVQLSNSKQKITKPGNVHKRAISEATDDTTPSSPAGSATNPSSIPVPATQYITTPHSQAESATQPLPTPAAATQSITTPNTAADRATTFSSFTCTCISIARFCERPVITGQHTGCLPGSFCCPHT